jgi:transposase
MDGEEDVGVANRRLAMRQIKDILRLHWSQGLSMRSIAQSLGMSYGSVHEVVRRATEAALAWPLPAELDEAALERALYAGHQGRPRVRPEPDWPAVDRELRQRKGVTLQLLWLEYKHAHSDGLQYTQYCQHFARWQRTQDVVLRQSYRAGEKMFVDYAGPGLPVVDPGTGEIRYASLFVAALGASSMTFAEAHENRTLPHWIGGNTRALEYYRGVPEVVVHDNLRTAVQHACWYEPELNRTYADWAAHYGTVILPTRPAHPRDNAKAEAAVLLAERWILAVLRHRTITSVAGWNAAIAPLREALNDRPFRKREGTRRQLFETLDRPALRPLPPEPYEFAEWRQAKVPFDYHVTVDHNFYSVPYRLIADQVDIRLTARIVEVLHRGRRVASHVRASGRGHYVTDPSHRPAAHQRYLDWSPERLIRYATSVGPHTARLVETILRERPHPEHGYRTCMGIIQLGKHYPPARLEAAAARALAVHAHSYRSLKSILEKGLDQTALDLVPEGPAVGAHANVRGAEYFADTKEGRH